jgi:signal transduction histidine kinase
LDLIFDPDPDLPEIRGEPNQLARVVSNLLSNAIRYTSSGWIKVSTYQVDGNFHEISNQSVCVQVEDSGMGISNDDLHHIFERFYRGRNVAQAKFPGTGLGLAIAKEIVDMHSGFIEVESQMEKGSCFRIWLPVEV